MAGATHDDGFHEIQLNGKQLVFLFMAVTVVLVVTFLTGVLVGRGVRAERASEQQAEVLDEAPASPPRATIVPQQGMDPTQAVPTVGAEERADSTAKADVPQPVEEPPAESPAVEEPGTEPEAVKEPESEENSASEG